MEIRFFKCNHCGQVIYKLVDTTVPVICCGEKMTEIVAGSGDGAVEKHVPVLEVKGGKAYVTVGAVAHPMLAEHSIQFILIKTNNGVQVKYLNPGEEPKAEFNIGDEKVEEVYEYCNLHGLFKA